MSVDVFLSAIGTVGFPCIVSIYLLYRLDSTIKDMSKSIEALTISINKLIFKEDKQKG